MSDLVMVIHVSMTIGGAPASCGRSHLVTGVLCGRKKGGRGKVNGNERDNAALARDREFVG